MKDNLLTRHNQFLSLLCAPECVFTHNCDEAGLLGMESAVVWSCRDEEAVWRLYPSSLSLAAGSSSISPSGSDKNPSTPSPSSSPHTSGPLTSLCTLVPEAFSPRPTLLPSSAFLSCKDGERCRGIQAELAVQEYCGATHFAFQNSNYKHHVRSVLVGCYTLGCLSVSGLSSNTESAKIVKMNNKKEMVMQNA